MARNVHKQEVQIISLPSEAVSEDRGLSLCGTPQRVLASTTDAAYYKNDRTGIAYKFDSMTVELEKDGVLTEAPGMAVTFPHQSDAVGFVIDWRQVQAEGVLLQGCYKIKISWELAGNSGFFYYGAFELREYTVFNARGTVRLFVVLNDLVRKQGINYKDSGFANTLRFKGQFGYMQPNYDTENLIYTDRIREKVRNEALRSYELRSSFLLSCMTRLIDEEHLLAANQIYISDHNANNHRQYFDYPVILSEDESPSFEYDDTPYAKIKAFFKDKTAVHESKYDGNIKGSANIILDLPTVVATSSCEPVIIHNSNNTFTDSAESGSDFELPDEVLNVYVNGDLNQTTTYIPLSGEDINISV